MQRLSYPTETVISNKIMINRIVISFKHSPRNVLGRRPGVSYPTTIPVTLKTTKRTNDKVKDSGSE